MRYISLFSGIEACSVAWKSLGWEPVAFADFEKFPSAVLAHHYPEVPNLGDVTKVNWNEWKGKADVVVGGSPCQSFSVAGRRLDSMTRVATWPSTMQGLLQMLSQPGSSTKTSQVSCHQMEDGTWEPSSQRWGTSGMASPGECWTLNSLEWPNAAAAFSLSDTLQEIGDVPQRFYLSQKACRGILRRAERRGGLAQILRTALSQTAGDVKNEWSVLERQRLRGMSDEGRHGPTMPDKNQFQAVLEPHYVGGEVSHTLHHSYAQKYTSARTPGTVCLWSSLRLSRRINAMRYASSRLRLPSAGLG